MDKIGPGGNVILTFLKDTKKHRTFYLTVNDHSRTHQKAFFMYQVFETERNERRDYSRSVGFVNGKNYYHSEK